MTLVISKGLTLDNGTRAAAIAGVSPTLDYRFAREKREIEKVSLTDKLTFTGGNQGTFVGSDGFIQRATTNVPRFDHDPLSRQSLGLLSEVERTNLLLRSEELNSASWTSTVTGTGSTPIVTPNYALAPNGLFTAARVQADRGAGNTASDQSTLVQIVTGLSNPHIIVLSVGMRSNTGSSQQVYFRNETGSGGSLVTVTTEWQRYSVITGAVASTVDRIQVGSRGTINSNNLVDILVWGAQLEAASTPSTYIPTTTTAVTRTADSAVIDGTGVLTGTYTMVEKPAGCAVVSGTNINLQPGFTAERVMVFPAALDAGQITAIRGAM